MKISLIEPLGVSEDLIAKLSATFLTEGHIFNYYNEKPENAEELIRRSQNSDIVMLANTPYPGTIMRQNPKLKMLSVAFTGIDHIDLNYCRNKNITICNSANYSNQSVAELSVCLTLTLYRSILACNTATRISKTGAQLTGMEISGKTVGIIGTGKIGLQTARLFQAFGARVIGYSRSASSQATALGITYYSLEELLRISDIVSLHIPSTPETYHLLNQSRLSLMKDSSILINCARGPVVDNTALAEALKAKKIAGAGIDVYDMEPPLSLDYPLLSAPNTVLTPHIAYATKESMNRRAEIVFENVRLYLKAQPQNVCPL